MLDVYHLGVDQLSRATSPEALEKTVERSEGLRGPLWVRWRNLNLKIYSRSLQHTKEMGGSQMFHLLCFIFKDACMANVFNSINRS